MSDRPDQHDDARLRLAAENVAVSKRLVETGRVRVATVTREDERLVDEPLERVDVEITRVPVGRTVDSVPEIRQEGDVTIVPVVEEILVLQRRLVLKEEVRIGRVRSTGRHRETVTLRREEAVVTRLPAEEAPDPLPE